MTIESKVSNEFADEWMSFTDKKMAQSQQDLVLFTTRVPDTNDTSATQV